MSRDVEKLRRQDSMVNNLTVFPNESPPHSFSTTIALSVPTANTLELVHLTRLALKRIWAPDIRYAKAGVVMSGLESKLGITLDLFSNQPQDAKVTSLMDRLDTIHQRYGTGKVKVAVAVSGQDSTPWQGQSQRCSPAYTTDWDGLLKVLI